MATEKTISERILDAAVQVLRRHGADKTNVVDIARVLGMSHGNIYRHFPTKRALISAVVVRWLQAVAEPLDFIAQNARRTPTKRLEAWFQTLREIKRRKVLDDPELFRVHQQIASDFPEVIADHVATLTGQLEAIISAGIDAGEFSRKLDPPTAARAFLQATSPFHHPTFLLQNSSYSEKEADAVFKLLLTGMKAA